MRDGVGWFTYVRRVSLIQKSEKFAFFLTLRQRSRGETFLFFMTSLPRGSAVGSVLVGVLVGIALHSFLPWYTWGIVTWSVVLTIFVAACIGWRVPILLNYKRELLILVGLLISLIRFQSTQAIQPREVKPFDPKGLISNEFSLQSANQLDPRHWTGRLRTELTRRSNKLFPKDESGLLVGILYGDKQLPPNLKAIFRKIGTSHIMAVSGSNVTIVIGCLLGPLLWIGLGRRTAYVVASVGIFLFVLLALPSASVARAAFMGWLVLSAPMVGRLVNFNRLLLIAAVAYACWQPWALMYDPSFALSFLAMIGLGTFGRLIADKLSKRIKSPLFREIISSNIGATLLTTPYGMWAFQQVSLIGVFANLAILPWIPWTMAFGAVALVFPRIPILAIPASACLRVVLTLSNLFGQLPVGSWSKLSTSLWFMLGMYGGLYLIWRKVKPRKTLIPVQGTGS